MLIPPGLFHPGGLSNSFLFKNRMSLHCLPMQSNGLILPSPASLLRGAGYRYTPRCAGKASSGPPEKTDLSQWVRLLATRPKYVIVFECLC